MTDPIAVLQRAAEVAAAAPTLTEDPVAAVRARVDRHRTRRRVRIGAVAAAVALVAGAAVLVTSSRDEGERDGVATTPDPTTTTEAEVGPYGDVPPSPLSTRRDVALAPVGADEVVVWGGTSGTTFLDDGAVYDRSTGEWRAMAQSPLAGRFAEGSPPVAVAVDGGVVIARGFAVVRWDRATDTWTELDQAPGVVADLVAVGDRLASFNAGAVLDLATGSWERFGSAVPHGIGIGRAVAVTSTGSELIAIGVTRDDPDQIQAAALDLDTLEWRELPPPPLGGLAVAATWDGERVLVTDQEMRAAAYDRATGFWTPLERVPGRAAEQLVAMGSVAGVTVTETEHGLSTYDRDRMRWMPFPSLDRRDGPGRLVPVDDTTLAVWVDEAGPNEADLVLFDPTTLAERDRRRQVGAISVILGPDDEVTAATRTDEALVVLSIAPAERGPCQVTNGFPRPQGTPEQRAVEEEISGLSGPKVWFHDTAATHWETETGDQDLVTVECEDPAAARRLVEATVLATPR